MLKYIFFYHVFSSYQEGGPTGAGKTRCLAVEKTDPYKSLCSIKNCSAKPEVPWGQLQTKGFENLRHAARMSKYWFLTRHWLPRRFNSVFSSMCSKQQTSKYPATHAHRNGLFRIHSSKPCHSSTSLGSETEYNALQLSLSHTLDWF